MHVEIDEGIRSILIVEDEMIVAMLMEDLVRELGVRDVHVRADVASALELIRTTPIDCAVLDLRLRNSNSEEIADALAERGIPFVFSTGSDVGDLDGRYADRPVISKPFHDDDFKLILLDTWVLERPVMPLEGIADLRVATSGATD